MLRGNYTKNKREVSNLKEYIVKLSLDELCTIDLCLDTRMVQAKSIDELEQLYDLANKIRGVVDSEE